MTQKELSYFEDAIGHESNIIKIINDTINKLDNEELKVFMNEELQKHETLKQNLMNKLEVKVNG